MLNEAQSGIAGFGLLCLSMIWRILSNFFTIRKAKDVASLYLTHHEFIKRLIAAIIWSELKILSRVCP